MKDLAHLQRASDGLRQDIAKRGRVVRPELRNQAISTVNADARRKLLAGNRERPQSHRLQQLDLRGGRPHVRHLFVMLQRQPDKPGRQFPFLQQCRRETSACVNASSCFS